MLQRERCLWKGENWYPSGSIVVLTKLTSHHIFCRRCFFVFFSHSTHYHTRERYTNCTQNLEMLVNTLKCFLFWKKWRYRVSFIKLDMNWFIRNMSFYTRNFFFRCCCCCWWKFVWKTNFIYYKTVKLFYIELSGSYSTLFLSHTGSLIS